MTAFLKTSEVIDYLGISRATLWRWRYRTANPFPEPIRICAGAQQYYRMADVYQWLDREFSRERSAS
jgi:predicted DNA-binding transcriptional regulator AlpA